ncbi:MAG: VOC family protein [Burkholderiaceae bacterium]
MASAFETPGALSWGELMTSDPDAAIAFYSQLFGWETEEMSNPQMRYTVVKAGGQAIGGIMAIPGQAAGMPPSWFNYVTVADIDAIARKTSELGGTVMMGPQEIPEVGRFCVIRDPQGAVINAIQYAMPADNHS